jgi:alpha-N-arabinofuranosidase
VDAVAARDTAGRLWLAVTNTDPGNPASIRAAIAGMNVKSASGQLLTAPAIDSHNSFDHPHAVEPVAYRARVSNRELALDLPPRSIAVLQVQ